MMMPVKIKAFVRSPEVKEILDDNLPEVAQIVLNAYADGELQNAIKNGHDDWQKWVKSVGKSLKRKVSSFTISRKIKLSFSY